MRCQLTLTQEFFDPNIRSLAQAATTSSNWLFNFLISRFTKQMFAKMHYETKPIWKAHAKVKAQLKEEEEQFRFEIKEGVFGKEGNGAHAHVEDPKRGEETDDTRVNEV